MSQVFDTHNWVGYIPVNPAVGGMVHGEVSKKYQEVMTANATRRTESKERVVIPSPPVSERVESKPAERRKFLQPPVAVSDNVFRNRR